MMVKELSECCTPASAVKIDLTTANTISKEEEVRSVDFENIIEFKKDGVRSIHKIYVHLDASSAYVSDMDEYYALVDKIIAWKAFENKTIFLSKEASGHSLYFRLKDGEDSLIIFAYISYGICDDVLGGMLSKITGCYQVKKVCHQEATTYESWVCEK